jgi:alpha-glucosidase
VLNAEIGQFLTIARKFKTDWYIGSITNNQSREFAVELSFLEKGKLYLAEIYSDSPKTNLKTNPTAYEMSKLIVDKSSSLQIKMTNGGGCAVRLHLIED